jgi:hypothetical protein
MKLFASAGHVSVRPLALLQAILGFALLDFATNVIMFPSRALLGDLVAAEQQHDVQSAAAVIASVAEICAGAYIYSWDSPVTHISRLFLVASALMLVSVAISLVVCVEEPLGLRPADAGARASERDMELQSVDGSDGGRDADSSEASPRTRTGTGDGNGDAEGERAVFALEDGDGAAAGEEGEVQRFCASVGTDDGASVGGEGGGAVGDPTGARYPDSPPGPAAFRPDSPHPARRRQKSSAESLVDVSQEVMAVVRSAVTNFPPELIRVGIVYGLGWLCWFATLPAYSVWIGESVLGGSPTAEPGSDREHLYQNGVTVFALATLAKSILALVFSLAYPGTSMFASSKWRPSLECIVAPDVDLPSAVAIRLCAFVQSSCGLSATLEKRLDAVSGSSLVSRSSSSRTAFGQTRSPEGTAPLGKTPPLR